MLLKLIDISFLNLNNKLEIASDFLSKFLVSNLFLDDKGSLYLLTYRVITKRKSGFIVGISSVAGERGRQSNYIYASSKSAFTIYLDGLRNRLFTSNVHVLTVKPGFVYTKMTHHLNLPKLLTANPSKVAQDIVKAQQKKKNILYTLWFWKLIMLII